MAHEVIEFLASEFELSNDSEDDEQDSDNLGEHVLKFLNQEIFVKGLNHDGIVWVFSKTSRIGKLFGMAINDKVTGMLGTLFVQYWEDGCKFSNTPIGNRFLSSAESAFKRSAFVGDGEGGFKLSEAPVGKRLLSAADSALESIIASTLLKPKGGLRYTLTKAVFEHENFMSCVMECQLDDAKCRDMWVEHFEGSIIFTKTANAGGGHDFTLSGGSSIGKCFRQSSLQALKTRTRSFGRTPAFCRRHREEDFGGRNQDLQGEASEKERAADKVKFAALEKELNDKALFFAVVVLLISVILSVIVAKW